MARQQIMNLPALDANGFPLKREDGRVITSPEHQRSACVLFQLSFELLLKSLIKLRGNQPLRNGWHRHNLLKLWDMVAIDFQALSSIQEEDLKILEELSSIGDSDLNLIQLKSGRGCLSLSEGPTPLLESLSRLYQLFNGEIETFVANKATCDLH